MAPQRFSLWLPLKPNKTGVPTQKSRPCETVMAFGSFFLSGTPCWSVGFFFFGKPQEHHPSFVCGSFPDKDSPPIRALERIQISPPPAPAESPPPPQTKTTLGSEQDPGDPMEIQGCPVSSKEASGLYERIPSFCYKETMSKFELLRSTRVAAHALTDPGLPVPRQAPLADQVGTLEGLALPDSDSALNAADPRSPEEKAEPRRTKYSLSKKQFQGKGRCSSWESGCIAGRRCMLPGTRSLKTNV